MAKPLGFILDQGSSPIDGSPYVAILTLKSSNRKTGNMAQVWILRSDLNPVEAIATGDDYSICGNCPHRKGENSYVDGVLNYTDKGSRSCYVNVGQAPLSVWRAFKAGKYETDLTVEQGKKYLSKIKIRWGAYGDPAIINPIIFNAVNGAAAGHTAYTHQWREDWAQWAKGSMQASCDGMQDYLEASAHGWKTFSVVPSNVEYAGIKKCPATVEGSKAQCLTCSLCDGDKTDIYVQAHGSGAKHVVSV
jgi:hypothetical protein